MTCTATTTKRGFATPYQILVLLFCAVTLLCLILFWQPTNVDAYLLENSVKNEADQQTKEPSILFLVPKTPDTSISQKLREVIPDEDLGMLETCRPTSQVKILTAKGSKWILKSFDDEGNEKKMGGDEFYIVYHNNLLSKGHPTAIALIEDLHDGTYKLDFVAPPVVLGSTYENSEDYVGGTVTVHFQYTCGIGFLHPPTKDAWQTGGALQQFYTAKVPHQPPIRPFQAPASVQLSKFERVLVFGDSAMKQFVKNSSRAFEPNIIFRVKRRKPWTTSLVKDHFKVLQQQLGRDLEAADNKPPHAVALVLGSSIWDVLASRKEHASPLQHQEKSALFHYNDNSPFTDHIVACQQMISHVREKYPNVDILWKSPTAMHVHVVDPQNPVNHVKMEKINATDEVAALLQRVRYMSSSRMFHLYKLQRKLMFDLEVTFLDVYEATFLSASYTLPGDGRHYIPELHKHMLSWFY